MKILRNGDNFVKMPDSSVADMIKINSMTERGWIFSSKSDYKTSVNGEKISKSEAKAEARDVKDEAKKDKKVKEVKEVKKETKNAKKDKKGKK